MQCGKERWHSGSSASFPCRCRSASADQTVSTVCAVTRLNTLPCLSASAEQNTRSQRRVIRRQRDPHAFPRIKGKNFHI